MNSSTPRDEPSKAALIVGAMERRQRLLITSFRGKLGRFVRLVAPRLIDRIANRAIRRGV